LLAAACRPNKGSDSAVGWGRAVEAAKYFDTWVICGHRDKYDVTDFLAKHGQIPGLHFCFLDRWWVEDLLQAGRPFFDIHYLPYHFWHRRAFNLARSLHRKVKFDLVHQVSRVGYREPGYLWKMDVPFIWGPIGGTQNYPWRFLWLSGIKGAIKEGLRTVINVLQLRCSPRVRLAAQKAAKVIAANSQVQRDFARVHGVKAEILLDTGLNTVEAELHNPTRQDRPLHILWSGQFEYHKGLPILLRALIQFPSERQYELMILGAGPLENSWKKMAQGIASHCHWRGWLKHEEAMKQYGWADVLVSTSLRETSSNVILEALSHGVPVVCLDHQGPGDIVTTACGIKIAVTTPDQVINNLRDILCSLDDDRARLQRMSGFARERAREYLWGRNGERMARIYQAVWMAKPHAELQP
jgi:glycosyltransferase involved in cell wall biosynthesis